MAASNGHIDVIRLLAARHADLALANRIGKAPIDVAIASNNAPLVIALIEANTTISDDVLCVAATIRPDVIRVLLSRGCNIAALRTRAQATPCHVAVKHRKHAVIDMLVNVGVDLDARDNRGRTCCHIAAITRNSVALRRFIAAGADIDIADSDGSTPRDHVTGDCATVLIAAGANLHHLDSLGFNACHMALLMSATVSLHALIAGGFEYDEPDMPPHSLAAKWTPLKPTGDELALARRKIAAAQRSFVCPRAVDVCIALRSLDLDALCMCEILIRSCGPVAPVLPFHIWWKIATTVKHHNEQR